MTKLVKIKEENKGRINVLRQCLQDMDYYVKVHIHDALDVMLRPKILLLSRYCSNPKNKRILRGILCYLSRWPPMKTFLRVTQVVESECQMLKVKELQPEQIIYGRFVKPRDVVAALKWPAITGRNQAQEFDEHLAIKSEKSS